MSLQKAEAIVLKIQKLGETSKIVILFSKEFGLIKVVAKGARGTKSKFLGSLDPINHVGIVFYHKEQRDLHLLSQADIIESFKSIKQDLNKLAYSMMAAEMVMRSQMERDPHANLFHLFVAFLRKLNESHNINENVFFWFQIRFLKWLGFKPNLKMCQKCRKYIIDDERVRFSVEQGGWWCEHCSGVSGVTVVVSGKTINYLNQIEDSSLEAIDQISNGTEIYKESSLLLNKFMVYHIESLVHMKSVSFLEDVQRN
ncbi:DNA repair protein RecO [candidate division KSB1 bacterium]|nr:DNA repair protein RecO [candidate division KSB1 bacterium]